MSDSSSVLAEDHSSSRWSMASRCSLTCQSSWISASSATANLLGKKRKPWLFDLDPFTRTRGCDPEPEGSRSNQRIHSAAGRAFDSVHGDHFYLQTSIPTEWVIISDLINQWSGSSGSPVFQMSWSKWRSVPAAPFWIRMLSFILKPLATFRHMLQ